MSARGRTMAAALVALAGLAAVACRPGPMEPCFRTTSPADVPWLTHQALEWEIDEMAALPSAPLTDAPPSEGFIRAQRDVKTEFWLDAAKELLAVERGDTHDDRRTRQVAQYLLAVALYRLQYYLEARRIFRKVELTKDHPMQEEAYHWTHRKACG
jgi:hypothetical protein